MRPGFIAVVIYSDGRLSSYSSAKLAGLLPDSSCYELHNGTPIKMQPRGDHEEVISFLNAVLILEFQRLGRPFGRSKQALVKLPEEVRPTYQT